MIANVIHDLGRKDRYINIMHQMRSQRFSVNFYSAIRKDNPTEGCTRAHKSVVQTAGMNKHMCVLIMEDDVMFTRASAFDYFIDHLPADFDIYTAGTYGQNCKYNPDDRTVRRMSGTHCYIVHERFYPTFMNLSDTEHLDESISNSGAKIILCNPMCAIQMPGYSDIKKEEVNYNTTQFINYNLY